MARKNTPKVYKRVRDQEPMIRKIAEMLLVETELGDLDGWDIFVTDTKRGYCNYSKRVVTIPMWAIRKHMSGVDDGYHIYYTAHELAHMVLPPSIEPHGDTFMRTFKLLCPVEFQHYEYGYKPRNAKRNGVTQKTNMEK